jgi:C4-dicarboxylate transporter DctQ subunit
MEKGRIQWLEKIQEWILVIGLTVITLVTFSSVVGRYLLGTSFVWSEELTRYIMIWLTFIGASLGIVRGAHIKIDVLRLLVSKRKQAFFQSLSSMLCVVGSLFFTFYAIVFIKEQMSLHQLSSVLKIPIWAVQSVFVISGVLMIIHWLQQLFTDDEEFPSDLEEQDMIGDINDPAQPIKQSL